MLHTEEIEIIIPDKISKADDLPLILSIGPTFTMAVPIILMLCFGNRIYGNNSHNFMLMSLITGGSTCIMGIIWGLSSRIYKNKDYKHKAVRRIEDYKRYLSDMRNYLLLCMDENGKYYEKHYPCLKEILNSERSASRNLEARDAFFLRLGLGRRDFDVKLKKQDDRREMFKSDESIMADELIDDFKFMNNAPVGIDLNVNHKLALIGELYSSNTYSYLKVLMIYMSAAYRPCDVKIAVIFDEANEYQREYYELFKFLPHVFAFDNKRLMAGNEKELSYILPDIDSNKDNNNFIFIVLDDKPLRGDFLYDLLLENDSDTIKVIALFKAEGDVPHNFKVTVKIPSEGSDTGAVFYEHDYDTTAFSFKTDDINTTDNKLIDEFVRNKFIKKDILKIENIPAPLYVDFFNMYNAISVKDINIIKNWSTNHPEDRIKVPIGVGENNKYIYLDVHEKFHGPHGLIAGTTGSGKSELLQTYLISLCIQFSPDDINFFLIDYKGGGTGNVIKNLPHCAGTISNLSGSDIKRAMSAIKSENRRRQRLLSEYGVNHIDAYMQLYRRKEVELSLPHLLLIIDEFAELKKEEPEFMKEIVSLAAVGRSLGIHLILATQKPAGVIDDKIWSNSRFKLCLKVQDKMDSMDMLHRKEAAFLTRSGQCYFQIGNDEYFTYFQTAYCGGKSSDAERKESDVCAVKRSGERISYKDEAKSSDVLTELEELVNYVNQKANEHGYKKAKSLWIDELKDVLNAPAFSSNVCDAKSPLLSLGRYDDPANQKQEVMLYEPQRDGHFAAAGMPGCGKTNLLKVMLSQLINNRFIIIDIGGESFIDYSKEKNCLGILVDESNIEIFFYHFKKLYKKYEAPMFVIIDNFAAFYKKLNEEEADFIKKVIDEGISRNIYCIFTANIISDFPSRIFSKIKTTLCMEMNDKFQYGDICRKYNLDTYPKSGVPGRCLYRIEECILEGQIYNSTHEVMSTEKPKIFGIEKRLFIDDMIEEYLNCNYYDPEVIPLGYSLKSGLIRGVTVKENSIFIISGLYGTGKHTLIDNIRKYIMKCDRSIKDKVVIIENLKDIKDISFLNSKFIISMFDQTRDSDILHNSAYAGLLKNIQGIHLGGNTAAQRILDLSDISYSAASIKTPPGYGILKLDFKNCSMKIRIPSNKKEVIEDDYD